MSITIRSLYCFLLRKITYPIKILDGKKKKQSNLRHFKSHFVNCLLEIDAFSKLLSRGRAAALAPFIAIPAGWSVQGHK